MTAPCHYRPGEPRALTGRHEPDCDAGACKGCQPCPEDHCRQCGIEHETHVCGGCLAAVRSDLDRIVALWADLAAQATDAGKDGRLAAAASIPGGEATVMLGPWSYGHNSGHDPDFWTEDHRDADFHPLLTLESWATVWREWYGQPTGLRATIGRAAGYLGDHLHEMAQAGPRIDGDTLEFPPDFDEMVTSVRQVRGRIEDVLCDGLRLERTKVPCLDCGRLLVPQYADAAADDHWRCPGRDCRRRYDGAEFAQAKHHQLASEGADVWVKLNDAAQSIDRPVKTLRTWVARWQVLGACHRVTHARLVWWPDVRRAHREAQMREQTRGRVGA